MRLSAIHTYPVKGCRGVDHDSAVVEPWGLAGDRRWLITDPDAVALTQRDVATLGQLRAMPGPDGLLLSYLDREPFLVPTLENDPQTTGNVWGTTVAATPAGHEADVWLGAALGRPVRLIWLDDPTRRRPPPGLGQRDDRVSFADELPLLLANAASLDRLNDWIAESGSDEGPLPMNRFRPNVVVEGAEPFEEDRWVGNIIHIGQMSFRVPQGCGRCVVTTIDQTSGVPGKEPLRTLGRYRNVDQKLLFGVHLIPVAPGRIQLGDPVTA